MQEGDTLESVVDRIEQSRHHRYTVAQVEVCPETKREHTQGYSEFANPVRISSLRNCLPSIHCEKRRGSRAQARDYCRKEASRSHAEGSGPTERGAWTGGICDGA